MQAVIVWMQTVSTHVTGLNPIPTADTVCSLGRISCCEAGGDVSFMGADLHSDTVWKSLARGVPITDCSLGYGHVSITFAGLRVSSDLSQLPVPPEHVSKLNLADCEGCEPAGFLVLYVLFCFANFLSYLL